VEKATEYRSLDFI